MTISEPNRAQTSVAAEAPDPTVGTLVHDLTQQVPELVRSELRLAQAEMTEKGKRAGLGIGMLGGAGLLAHYGALVLITTAVLALDLVMAAWLAALLVALFLLTIAGLVALLGKKKVAQATPAMPERAIEGVKEDLATVKGARS